MFLQMCFILFIHPKKNKKYYILVNQGCKVFVEGFGIQVENNSTILVYQMNVHFEILSLDYKNLWQVVKAKSGLPGWYYVLKQEQLKLDGR